MTQRTVKLGFTRYSDKSLERKARKVLVHMDGNSHFPDPVPSLKDIQQQLAEFSASVEALDGRDVNYMLKKRARRTLETSLKLLGQYVRRQAQNHENILESSGYDMIQDGGVNHQLEQPGGFRIKTGAGCVLASAEAVKGADSYLFQYTEAPITGDSIWNTETDTRPVHAFTHLVRGKAYCFRMAAAAGIAAPAFTEVITRLLR